ncbi:MAG: tetratricopeptide repeat protein [Gammaproteobacteria bacterium]|nr:tetratricopeptide repeat protein [Gammaproteobacteria bacterium]
MIATIAVYLPGLSGGFVFDDAVNIAENPQLRIADLTPESLMQAAGSAINGSRDRPISMLSFGINHALTGLDPWWMKTTNLGIHLLNGLLIFLLSYQLLKALVRRHPLQADPSTLHWVALATTAAWMLHPLNLSPVLYVVQRMASLTTLFMLLGLLAYVSGRIRMLDGRSRSGAILAVGAIALMTPLAYLAKENGVLLPLLALVAEVTLFGFRDKNGAQVRWLIALFAITVGLPAIAGTIYFLFNPSYVLNGYQIKPFTFTERVLSEPRVLWHYIAQLFIPRLNEMSVYNDDVVVSTGLFSPWTTIPAAAAWFVAFLLALRFRTRWPIPAFAVLFFIGGHAIESSIFPLLIAQDHRNYLPSFGPLLALSWLLFSAGLHPSTARLRRIGGIAMIVLFALLTLLRSMSWADPLSQAIDEVSNHPLSPRAHNLIGGMYGRAVADPNLAPSMSHDELFRLATYHLQRSSELLPTSISSLSSIALLHALTKRPLPADLIDRIVERLRADKVDVDHLSGLSGLAHTSTVDPKLIPGTLIEFMYEQALENPTYPKSIRAILLMRYAKILRDHDARFGDRAIAMTREAISLNPSTLQFRVNLAVLLMSLNRLDEAERELNAAEAMDPLRTIDNQLTLNRRHLKRLRGNPTPPSE